MTGEIEVDLVDIENEYDRPADNVRRALRDMGDLLLGEYADEKLWSEYVA